MGAIRTGFRHARNNRHLRATLARSAGFFLFASAYWALLPLVARDQIGSGPELYGILLGAIGLGAMVGAFTLPKLKARFGHNGLATMGQAGTAAALFLYALAEEPIIAISASLIAGVCWIAVVANLNVSAQIALPEWVRGRGLAMYVTVFFGSMTVGSALWGELARTTGLTLALLMAAGGALLGAPLTARWKLRTAAGLDLNPSLHWPEPIVTGNVDSDAGPVMVLVEYRIDAKDREAFLGAIEELASERRRDGAYAWDVFQDTADDTRFTETFFLESWIEHLRQHHRVTNADRQVEQHLAKFFREPPVVTHLVAAGNERRSPIN
jgi:MFS family permease